MAYAETLEEFTWFSNPGFPQGGPQIEGPWQWLMLPIEETAHGLLVDYLAEASDGKVTEQQIATIGASDGIYGREQHMVEGDT